MLDHSNQIIEYQTTESNDNNHHHHHNHQQHIDLYVLIHGLHGDRSDFEFIAKKLKELYNADENSEHAIIIDCACNEGKTQQGIELLGANVLKEVLKILYERRISLSNKKKLKLSVIGHSLGGLIARYFVKLLLFFDTTDLDDGSARDEISKQHQQYFVENILPHVVPCSFTTVSSPHLGSRRPGGGSYFQSAYRFAAHSFISLLGKTGKQLLLNDGNTIEECLLYRMSLKESDFVRALQKFPNRTLISSCHLDSTVPFPSASIRSYNPYPISEYSAVPSMKIGGISSSFLTCPGYVNLLNEFFSVEEEGEEIEGNQQQINNTRRELTIKALLNSASWKGTEEDPFEGELNDSNKKLYRDNHYEVEFDGTILKNMQSIKWRRIDLYFTVSSLLESKEIHTVVLKKKLPIRFVHNNGMDKCGERCINLVAMLSKFDSDNFIEMDEMI